MGKGGMRWGAGRPAYRAKAEQLQRIDIRVWRKRGYLKPATYFSWVWSRGEERTGSIGVRVHDRHLLSLIYSLESDNGRRDASQTIDLAHTPCHYGNTRPWFVCPRCQRRAGLLFMRWGRFACRHCQRVAYSSQAEGFLDRIWRKQTKIESRVGYDFERPKGMRRSTHDALIAAWAACEERREKAFFWFDRKLSGLI